MTICIVTNYAAGISGQNLTEGEVSQIMRHTASQVRQAILSVVEKLGASWDCRCARARG